MADKKYRETNREKIRDYDKKYYRENREKIRIQRDSYYKKKGWAIKKIANRNYQRRRKIIAILKD